MKTRQNINLVGAGSVTSVPAKTRKRKMTLKSKSRKPAKVSKTTGRGSARSSRE
jgi:hypothetical protein